MTATEVNKNRRYDLNMEVVDFADFSTYFSAMADQVQSAITTVIPYVLPLVGIMLAIMVGIRVVKRITGKA